MTDNRSGELFSRYDPSRIQILTWVALCLLLYFAAEPLLVPYFAASMAIISTYLFVRNDYPLARTLAWTIPSAALFVVSVIAERMGVGAADLRRHALPRSLLPQFEASQGVVRQPGVTGADGTIVGMNDRPAGIELTGAAVPHVDTVLTPEALAFVADLHRSFNASPAGAAGEAGRAPGSLRRRRAPRLPARDRIGPRGWLLASGIGSRRTSTIAASRSPALPSRR